MKTPSIRALRLRAAHLAVVREDLVRRPGRGLRGSSWIRFPRTFSIIALLVGGSSLLGSTRSGSSETVSKPSAAFADDRVLNFIRTGQRPEGLELPAVYDDPSSIGAQRPSAFASPSPLLKLWLQLPTLRKVEILDAVMVSGDPQWLIAFVAEVAFAGIALEPDPVVADSIRVAVFRLATPYANVAEFLLDHIARNATHDEVRGRAQDDVVFLRRRVRDLGR